jgi:ligand-binding SRPBCC domain-containing protein
VILQIGPIRWVALHTAYEKNRFFEDQQLSGPFDKWIHRHEFDSAGESTRLTDRVEFLLPGGALVNHLLGWAVKLALSHMFSQRHRTTRKYCE